jgi:hypothetical protein
MREEPDQVAACIAFLCFAALGRHHNEPLYFDAFTAEPLWP